MVRCPSSKRNGVASLVTPGVVQESGCQVIKIINEWVKDNGAPFRAGFQMHKLFQVDEQDERSKPTASLSHWPRS